MIIMTEEVLTVGVTGHVDHGKSTLIGRLLYDSGSVPASIKDELEALCKESGKEFDYAYITDYFSDERDNQMTIDSSQLFFKLGDKRIVIIDTPGHREFVSAMITGASQAELAILVVDAKEGIKEQTYVHLEVLHLLGMRNLVIAVNKMDLVSNSEQVFKDVVSSLEHILSGMGFRVLASVPISAKLGDNVFEPSRNLGFYKGPVLGELLSSYSPHEQEQSSGSPARFPIQDIYHVDGQTIAVGRIESGALECGKQYVLLPAGSKVTLKQILKFREQNLAKASQGEAVGIAISGASTLARGLVLSDPGSPPTISRALRALVFTFQETPVSAGSRFQLKLNTQESGCRVISVLRSFDSELNPISAESIPSHSLGELELLADSEVVFDPNSSIPETSRFVLEQQGKIVGFGIIVN